ncbi:centrosomal protein of 131 kDa [Pholidichthys leucotaenia]
MHTTSRSPSSIPVGVSEDALDLSLSGSQLSMSKRPSSASPGKFFSRSVSVSVAADGRGKSNTLSDVSLGSSRSIKNLRRSNSTTQVNQPANTSLSQDHGEDYLTVFDSSSDGRKKLASLSKTSADTTTWNILDDQPRVFSSVASSSRSGVVSPSGLKKKEPGVALAATFTANNRSNKGAVGNSVTTILHNNYSEKPLTPKSSNQKPVFNNILKATANDEVSLDSGSVTKSQKNFSSVSNNKSLGSVQQPRRREVTEEEAERFIQQVNQAAVTIQHWYRRHIRRRHANQAALKHLLANKRKEWEERSEEEKESLLKQQQRRDKDRKQIREEKAHQARLAAIQELQQKRAQKAAEGQQAAEMEQKPLKLTAVGGRKKPAKSNPTNKSPSSPTNNSSMSPTDVKTKNMDSNVNTVADISELTFSAISPASSNHRGSQCSQDVEDRGELEASVHHHHHQADRKLMRKEKTDLSLLTAAQTNTAEGLQQKQFQQSAAIQTPEQENVTRAAVTGRKKLTKVPLTNQCPPSPSNNSPISPVDIKTKNIDCHLNVGTDVADFSFRAVSPASSNHRGSQSSQEILRRSVSVEDQRGSSRPLSKTTLTELLDTLKLLEEEPERLKETKIYHREKYAWIDEEESTSLTADNLERHGQLSLLHPPLPDGGVLLSEAKLQSIMSFLDEMEKSEQERPRSVTSGSHREVGLSEEDLAVMDQASATAAELSGSVMRMRVELEEKKQIVLMLQTALSQQRELTMRNIKEVEEELSRSYQQQKEQYEATIQRHLTFIDQLISDKKVLNERCEAVVTELKQVDHRYTRKISQMEEQHEMVWQILGPLCEEIKKLKEVMSTSEKIRREKWIDEKTKKIKEIAVKGLEPEIQKLISKHKQELKKLRMLHEVELQQADERAAQRCVHRCEELRQQLAKEKEEEVVREREQARVRCEKQLEEEQLSLQQQRRRLHQEVSEEKERLAQLADRQRGELVELRRQLEENSSIAGRALREELERGREEQERRHQMEVKALQERLDVEKQTWEENYKKREEAWLLSREHELKEELRRERDKEIEMAIWTLEEESSKDKEEWERAADNRVKRVREKYEAELRELEHSERSAVEKQQELRRQQTESEGELIRLKGVLTQKELLLQEVTQSRDRLVEERSSLEVVIRQEFADRLVTLEEENRRMKAEVSEVRARLRLEVERITREKEEELEEVHQRVKSAILKKEETVSNLRKQHEAAVKRADHLEALWKQQRKQLLQK